MSKWSSVDNIPNVWGSFKSGLFDNLSSLSAEIDQNSSDISKSVTKKQFGISNAFRYKSNNIFTDSSSDLYQYLFTYYASGSSNAKSNNYKKTITYSGRIFEYDCSNKYVIEINPTNGQITKYNMKVDNNNSIEYLWYIGTYVDGNDIYSYLWGTGSSGYGIFKVKHGDSISADSFTSLYIFDVAQNSNYYYNTDTTPEYSKATTYFRVLLSVLVGDSVYIICDPRTGTYIGASNYSTDSNIYFAWDGTLSPKKINVNCPSNFYSNSYTGNSPSYHFLRGFNLATNGNVTYTDSYKMSIDSSTDDTVTLTVEEVVPSYSGYSSTSSIYPICPCGFYDDYVVFGRTPSQFPNTLMFVPINDSSYYEIVPFINPSYDSKIAYYNRLVFTHIENGQNGKNYLFLPIFKYIDGCSDNGGVVLKSLDE